MGIKLYSGHWHRGMVGFLGRNGNTFVSSISTHRHYNLTLMDKEKKQAIRIMVVLSAMTITIVFLLVLNLNCRGIRIENAELKTKVDSLENAYNEQVAAAKFLLDRANIRNQHILDSLANTKK